MELRQCVDVLHQGLTVIEDLSIGEGVIRSRTAVYIVEGAVFHPLLYSLKVRLDMQGTHDKNGLQCDALKQKRSSLCFPLGPICFSSTQPSPARAK